MGILLPENGVLKTVYSTVDKPSYSKHRDELMRKPW